MTKQEFAKIIKVLEDFFQPRIPMADSKARIWYALVKHISFKNASAAAREAILKFRGFPTPKEFLSLSAALSERESHFQSRRRDDEAKNFLKDPGGSGDGGNERSFGVDMVRLTVKTLSMDLASEKNLKNILDEYKKLAYKYPSYNFSEMINSYEERLKKIGVA